jgi:2-keto-4-pentenoate hydratase/2-oxohepta-3-ene-1,7-dioic acid hydratase in catechol pathway
MIWCRFQKDKLVAYGIVEGDMVTAVEGDPFSHYRTTASKFKLSEIKLLVPVIPGTFYAIGSNYRNHVVGRAKVKGTAPRFYDAPRVGYRANSALIATGEDIVKPKDAGPRFEYEGELVAVIGKPARRVSPQEAADCKPNVPG